MVLTPEKEPSTPTEPAADRRADVEAKQARIAALLQEVACDGLVILEPENFAWLTSGGAARGVLDPAELPGLSFTADQRWVITCNVDSQRLFDEELTELGFQLKEWPWHWGREQLLNDLCQGRKVACDRALLTCKPLRDQLALARRTLTSYEQACFRALGTIVRPALEARCPATPNLSRRPPCLSAHRLRARMAAVPAGSRHRPHAGRDEPDAADR